VNINVHKLCEQYKYHRIYIYDQHEQKDVQIVFDVRTQQADWTVTKQ